MWINVEDVGPTLHTWYKNVLCLLGELSFFVGIYNIIIFRDQVTTNTRIGAYLACMLTRLHAFTMPVIYDKMTVA